MTKFPVRPFLYKSNFISKLVKLLTKNGFSEKVENKLLKVFKRIDYYVIFEIIYTLKTPFKFFAIKKQKGRRSFIRLFIISYVSLEEQLIIALKLFIKEFFKSTSSTKKNIDDLSTLMKNSQHSLLTLKKQKMKHALFIQKLHHYRW